MAYPVHSDEKEYEEELKRAKEIAPICGAIVVIGILMIFGTLVGAILYKSYRWLILGFIGIVLCISGALMGCSHEVTYDDF